MSASILSGCVSPLLRRSSDARARAPRDIVTLSGTSAARRSAAHTPNGASAMPMKACIRRLLELLGDIERHAREIVREDSEPARRIVSLVDEARKEVRHLESEITRVGR